MTNWEPTLIWVDGFQVLSNGVHQGRAAAVQGSSG